MIIRSICYATKMGLLDLIIHKVQGCMYHRGRPCGCYRSHGEGPHLRLFMSLGGEDFFLQVKLAIVTKTLPPPYKAFQYFSLSGSTSWKGPGVQDIYINGKKFPWGKYILTYSFYSCNCIQSMVTNEPPKKCFYQ